MSIFFEKKVDQKRNYRQYSLVSYKGKDYYKGLFKGHL